MIIGIQLHNQVVTTTTATGPSCDALNHNQGDKEQDDKDRDESYLFPRHGLTSFHSILSIILAQGRTQNVQRSFKNEK